MPRVIGPLLSESAEGTLGGLLFRSGTYGQIISRSSSSPAIRTPRQSEQRGALKRAHNSWDTLSPEHQSAWSEYAASPLTGRNTYIAAHIRCSMFGSIPDPWPGYPIDCGYLTALDAYMAPPMPGSRPLLYLSWVPHLSSGAVLNIFTHSTWSNRALPKPSKFKWLGAANLADGNYSEYLQIRAPVVWVRLEQIDLPSGALMAKYQIKARHLP
jgi:hypothetical protein